MTRPSIFADLGYEDALARGAAEQKLVLVDATAAWCQPCKVMDAVTWSAPEVESWIAKRAIAIQLDVDAEKELARALAVRSMPTVIAIRDRREVDRISGLKRPSELLAWLAGIESGRTVVDVLRERIASDPSDVRARWELASALVDRRDDAAATDAVAWVWEHALEHDPAFVGVRASYALARIAELSARSPLARARFEAIRGRARIDRPDVPARELDDWLGLSIAIGDRMAVFAWLAAAPPAVLAREDLAHAISMRVVPLLVSEQRWEDVCRVHLDPDAALARELAQHARLEADAHALPPGALAAMTKMSAQRLRVIHHALVVTGRTDRAAALEAAIAESALADAFAALG